MKVPRIITRLIILLSFFLNACNTHADTPHVELELIADDFASPVALITPPDGSHRLFILDQVGLIWIISEGQRIETPFLDLQSRLVDLNSLYDERGLLGLAFHPDFAINGRFYVSYSAPLRDGLSSSEWDHTTYISEFSVSADDPDQADPNSERVLLAMDKPGYNYEAGHLAFGPDGYLYIATGDSVHDPGTEAGQFAQDTFSLLGKILRIDVNGVADSAQNYLIPADNPFADGVDGRAEVYAYGFRNPYRFSFDTAQDKSLDTTDSGATRLFVADVGQAMMEEVNLVELGGNYGWPIREGTSCFNSESWNQPLDQCATQGLSDPIIVYPHQSDLSAIIGGMIYHGKAIPALNGGYVFGDWGRGNGHLFVAFPPSLGAGLWNITEIEIEIPDQTGIGQLLGIGQDENGELYLLTKDPGVGPAGNSGRVYKVIAARNE